MTGLSAHNSAPSALTLRGTITASPERVWRAWFTATDLEQWCHTEDITIQPGSVQVSDHRVQFTMLDDYLEASELRLDITDAMQHEYFTAAIPTSKAALYVTFTNRNDVTELRCTISSTYLTEQELRPLAQGWSECLRRLQQYLTDDVNS